MVNVTVSPIQTINVRVNTRNQQSVSSSVQFIGALGSQAQMALEVAEAAANTANTALSEVNEAYVLANNASIVANNASVKANNALPLTGGTITGVLNVTGNVVTQSDFVGIIDAGSF